ncbi:MAG: DUF4296 domain-containing protein [Flavobacteriaceae bacterium]|nr:DUF4296 domain-containing protein [Flavobacteriaceae bacterium]
MRLQKNIFISSKNRWLLLPLVLILLNSCQDVKMPERPDNLISEDKIVKIYSDAYINNAAKNVNNKLLVENGIKLDSVLYKKYSVDSIQFAKSNAYYSSDLSNYAEIFARVEIRLKIFQKRADSLILVKEIELEEAICDSMYPKDSLKLQSVKVDSSLIEPVVSD